MNKKMFTRIIALLLVIATMSSFAVGCVNHKTEEPAETEQRETQEAVTEMPTQPVTEINDKEIETAEDDSDENYIPIKEVTPPMSSLGELLEGIYNEKPISELPYSVQDIPVTDLELLQSFTGLKENEKLNSLSVLEPDTNGVAYSMVMVKVNNKNDAKAVADEMKENVDTKKWINAEANDIEVAIKDDMILLVMMPSDNDNGITSADMTDVFMRWEDIQKEKEALANEILNNTNTDKSAENEPEE